jgi:hypothetical protein
MQVDDLTLDIDTAIPCGLILNELVSNAFKHAFPVGQSGAINVELRGQGNRLTDLIVSDTGVGMPEDADLTQMKTLGLQLVMSLSRQLNGSIEICRDGGTKVHLAVAARR